MRVDLRLNAIVDPERAGGHDLIDLARRVAAGGATLVQLRDKRSETRIMVEEARAIKAALVPFAVPFVVNDRIDVALAALADGVHIGPDDMAVEDARRLLGPNAIIGFSIKTVPRLKQRRSNSSTMPASAASMRRSRNSRTARRSVTEGFSRVAAVLRRRVPQLPLCGIAGIDAGNAAAVIAAGADGVAVISALSLDRRPGRRRARVARSRRRHAGEARHVMRAARIRHY